MGIFGSKPHRVFSIQDRNYHPPKAFGFFCVKTAYDLATSTLKEWTGDVAGERELLAFIKAHPAVAQLQLIAVLVAVHYVYATKILKVPQDVLTEVRDGIAEGMNALTDNNQKATMNVVHMMHRSISYYVQALNQEISTSHDEPGVTPDCGSTSLTFTILLAREYDDEKYNSLAQNAVDDLFLQHLLADAWVALMTALQKNIQLKFIP